MMFFLILLLISFAKVNADCNSNGDLSYKCETIFAGQRESISIKLDTCREKPKLTFKLVVDALGIDWTETFKDSEDVEIPGLSSPLGGVYLKVEFKSDTSGRTRLQMKMYIKALFIKGPEIPLLDETVSKSSCNAFLYWWNSRETGAQAGVSSGGALVLIILIGCCCKCCCCGRSNNHTTQTTMVMAPQQPAANTVVVNNSTQQQQMYAPMAPMGQNPYGVPYKNF